MGLTPHPHLECRGPRKSRAIPLITLRAFVAYKKGENLRTRSQKKGFNNMVRRVNDAKLGASFVLTL